MKDSLEIVLKAGLVPFIQGSPGIGKSDIVRSVANKYNLKVIDIRLSQCDPTEINGFPFHDGKRMDYLPPKQFPLQELDSIPSGYNGWLIFLDEFNSASIATQAAAYKLILDRMIGVYSIHKNAAIVCAGNTENDNAIVNDMSTAMQSRLIHLELKTNIKEWIDWANQNNIDNRIKAFLEFRPDLLHKFDSNHNDKTFATPRTWAFASKLIQGKENISEILPILYGTVSKGVTIEFNAFCNQYMNLPKIQDILASPDEISIDDNNMGVLYALAYMISCYFDETTIDKLLIFVKRLPPEFSVVCMKAAIRRNKELLQHASIKEWISEFAQEVM